MRAPVLAPKTSIDHFVKLKTGWIIKVLQKSATHKVSRDYIDGENFLFYGRRLKLKFIKSNTNKIEVSLDELLVYGLSRLDIKPQIKKFFKSKTQELVENYLTEHLGEVPGVPTYKFYKSKWGSCSSKNELTFNAKLSMAPNVVVEYVVVHELVHFRVKNHSKKYWQQVEKILPDYREKRAWIRKNSPQMAL